MKEAVYQSLLERKNNRKKAFALLIDPDKTTPDHLGTLIPRAQKALVDYIFIGGSLVLTDHMDDCIDVIRQHSDLPVVLFPGHPSQVSAKADALLYLSLISGRNADLLIGQHVISAPAVRQSGVEVISTGYMVIDGGAPTSVSYISNAGPIPADKDDIAFCTAMAGEMLGKKIIYMDAGSGAKTPVSESMIRQVRAHIDIPLLIGGGIREPESAYRDCQAGADVIVVGNAIEKDPALLEEMGAAIHSVEQMKRV